MYKVSVTQVTSCQIYWAIKYSHEKSRRNWSSINFVFDIYQEVSLKVSFSLMMPTADCWNIKADWKQNIAKWNRKARSLSILKSWKLVIRKWYFHSNRKLFTKMEKKSKLVAVQGTNLPANNSINFIKLEGLVEKGRNSSFNISLAMPNFLYTTTLLDTSGVC